MIMMTKKRKSFAPVGRLTIEYVPIDDIRPYQNNPRDNEGAVDAVARSIQEFGFKIPIILDANNEIVAGHTRYKAARKLGMTEVPVIRAADLTPEQVRAFRIADNQTASLAAWNYDLLEIELLALQDVEFDLSLLAFPEREMEELLYPDGKQGLTDPDEIPEPPDEAITQPGDLWILGDHRLLCGDSGRPEDVDQLLAGATIQLVNTDPPYNVKVEPRSNNAIAAGLSSFSYLQQADHHHQQLDLARHPEKSKPTHKRMRAKDRPLANDFVSDEAFDRMLNAASASRMSAVSVTASRNICLDRRSRSRIDEIAN